MTQDVSGKTDSEESATSAAAATSAKAPKGKRPPAKRARKPKVQTRGGAKRQRRETRTYPGRTLEECIKVVEAIKTQNAGNPWPPDEIAKAIKIKSRSSNLSEIIRSANLYGLVEGTYRAATVSLTDLGRRLAYPPKDEELRQAKRDALYSVDLFKTVIAHYKGGAIPASPFVNNTLTREFKLADTFHDEFLRILRKNLEYVGEVSADLPIVSRALESSSRAKGNTDAPNKSSLRADPGSS